MTIEMQDFEVDASVMKVMARYHHAMIDGDPNELGGLLSQDFVLGHITGYEQPRSEWLAAVKSGRFDYHAISVKQIRVAKAKKEGQAVATGLVHIEATINGARALWPMQFLTELTQHSGTWFVVRASYTLTDTPQ